VETAWNWGRCIGKIEKNEKKGKGRASAKKSKNSTPQKTVIPLGKKTCSLHPQEKDVEGEGSAGSDCEVGHDMNEGEASVPKRKEGGGRHTIKKKEPE